MVKKQTVWKKVGAGAGVIALAIGSAGLGAWAFSTETQVENPVNTELAYQLGVSEAELVALQATLVETQEELDEARVAAATPVVETETVVVTELVDNEHLDLVVREVLERSGNVTFFTDGLSDDELDALVDRIVWADELRVLAEQTVRDEAVTLLDRERVSGVNLDAREFTRLRYLDLSLEESTVDWELREAELTQTVEFRQDERDYRAVVRVVFYEGEVDVVELDSVERLSK